MMARLWLRTVANYQSRAIAALQISEDDAVASAVVLHFFDWTAAHPGEAALLLRYAKDDIAMRWPDTLARELRTLNRTAGNALRAYARRRYGSDDQAITDRVMFALVDLPFAAVRRHLPDRGQPAMWLRDFTVRSAIEILHSIDVLEPGQTSAES